jgi:septum formation protein
MQTIILASQSPRRKALLELVGIPFEIVVKSTDESFPPDMKAEDVPVFLAREKATAVNRFLDKAYHEQHKDKTILAADTIVVLDGKIINKPEDRQHAIQMLSDLAGKKHKVITGVVLQTDHNEVSFSDTTEVEFHPLTEEQIKFYVDDHSPYDKAGAYAIQEWIGAVGIKCIHGDFYNVMGLPISRVVQELYKLRNSEAK